MARPRRRRRGNVVFLNGLSEPTPFREEILSMTARAFDQCRKRTGEEPDAFVVLVMKGHTVCSSWDFRGDRRKVPGGLTLLQAAEHLRSKIVIDHDD